MIKISVVIPTCNRPQCLKRCLKSISEQKRLPDEVIIVDSSDEVQDSAALNKEFERLAIKCIHSSRSVCKQRNEGIAAAQCDWIFLCDDDIEIPDNYLLLLKTYLEENELCHVTAGRLTQFENGNWVDQYPPKRMIDVAWRFVFQLSVWGSLAKVRFFPAFGFMRKWYARRRNDVSLAGWPILTEWDQYVTKTTIYPLGASLVRKQWLMNSPFDPVLDPHGIGDNYGVAINFPNPQSIHVLSSTFARHHLNPENRLKKTLAYYRRLLALHYFLKRKENSTMRSIWFIWSLFGNLIYFLIKGEGDMRSATWSAIGKIVFGRNPYWKGHLLKQERVEPYF
jgi:glycosyltransferase involved in cell wall biosynthesis